MSDVERPVACRRGRIAHRIEFVTVIYAGASCPVAVDRSLEQPCSIACRVVRATRQSVLAAYSDKKRVTARRRFLRKACDLSLRGVVPTDKFSRSAAIHVDRVARAERHHHVCEIMVVRADAHARLPTFHREHVKPAAVTGESQYCARMEIAVITREKRLAVLQHDIPARMRYPRLADLRLRKRSRQNVHSAVLPDDEYALDPVGGRR